MPENSPDILYRYMPAEYALMAIQSNELRLGRLSTLNDVFDCAPRWIEWSKDTDVRVEPKINSAMRNNFLDETMGILCFCDSATELLVWAHYGAGYGGVALGYDRKTLESLSGTIMKPVVYQSNQRPIVESTIPGQIGFESLLEAFSRKAPAWSYEGEHRLFFTSIEETQLRGSYYYSSLPKGALRQVVLGPRCTFSPYLIKDSIKQCEAYSSTFVDLLQVEMKEEVFELSLREVGKVHKELTIIWPRPRK